MLDLKKSQTQVHPEPMSWVEKLPDLAEMGTESEGHTGEPISQPCRADPRQCPSHSPLTALKSGSMAAPISQPCRADPWQRPSHSPAEQTHGSAHPTALQSGSMAAPISQPCRADPRQRPSHSPAERIHGSTHLRGLQSGSTAAPSFPAFSQQNSISQLRVTTGRGGLMRPVSF